MTTLNDCTFSGNTAVIRGGGVASYAGTMSLTNCTISGNSITGTANETGYGGGLWADGTTTLTNCTVSANYASRIGGGLMVGDTGTMILGNNIVAGNTTVNGESDVVTIVGTVDSDGYNLIGITTNVAFTTAKHDQFTNSGTPINPDLGALGNNGGPTQTMALLTGSRAIDKGSNSISGLTIPTTDERGACAHRPGSTPGSPSTSAPTRPARRTWSPARPTRAMSARSAPRSAGPTSTPTSTRPISPAPPPIRSRSTRRAPSRRRKRSRSRTAP